MLIDELKTRFEVKSYPERKRIDVTGDYGHQQCFHKAACEYRERENEPILSQYVGSKLPFILYAESG